MHRSRMRAARPITSSIRSITPRASAISRSSSLSSKRSASNRFDPAALATKLSGALDGERARLERSYSRRSDVLGSAAADGADPAEVERRDRDESAGPLCDSNQLDAAGPISAEGRRAMKHFAIRFDDRR